MVYTTSLELPSLLYDSVFPSYRKMSVGIHAIKCGGTPKVALGERKIGEHI